MSRSKKLFIMAPTIFSLTLFFVVGAKAQLGILQQQQQQQREHKLLSTQNGRYVFGQISESGKDQFMLDTLTGRLWRIAESGEVGIFLRNVPYRKTGSKYEPLPDDLGQSETDKEKTQ